MKIGDNIQEIRERERNYKRSYMASCLEISTRAYCNIENNITDITLKRLVEIAEIMECDPLIILQYKELNNKLSNPTEPIDVVQSNPEKKDTILQKELLETQKHILELLKNLLERNKIKL
ncbi:helix-turn-helix transcriptional regulator [Gramella sp. AN32]|uniref:Helix-turn-helix domain-containing protein n=1 Tax=Christiangramia antarctica TaxID=2058158 RepID=A0ABW5XAV2_9FLAO|nr:helix-turn-helix transcriptional regulator [Gramella sp. AN32]MCM4154414.1 hypothetical protein [Gramella sp. AN32]